MKKKLFILIGLLLFVSLILNKTYAIENVKYKETSDSLNFNPERGFYRTLSLKLEESENKSINYKSDIGSIVFLRVDISSFSYAQNKEKDKLLTEDAINALDKTIENIRNNGNNVILRFVYDKYGDGIKSDEGLLDSNGKRYVEPDINMIENHINELKDIFYKYEKTIYDIQLGFFGDYGELHGSSKCTEENINRAVDALINNTPEDISISVRTPSQLLSYAKYKNETNLDISNISNFITNRNMKSYRLGIYDDGYLGSASDLGTYKNRDEEIKFLNNQNAHTTFGGEAVINYDENAKIDGFAYMNKYSYVPNLELEATKTHTDYLNYEWNENLHNDWKKKIYDGIDSFYKALGLTYYDYIRSHLGYRYVLEDSKIESSSNNLKIYININNKGFSNIKKEKDTELIITDQDDNVILDNKTDFDIRRLDHGTKTIEFNLPIDDSFKEGDYKLYIRVSSGKIGNSYYLPVRFANEDVWNDKLNANFIDNFAFKRIKENNDTNDSKKENTNANERDNKKENIINNNSNTSKSDNNSTNVSNNNAKVNESKKTASIYSKQDKKENTNINKYKKEYDNKDNSDIITNKGENLAESKIVNKTINEKEANIFMYIMISLFAVLGILIIVLIVVDINE